MAWLKALFAKLGRLLLPKAKPDPPDIARSCGQGRDPLGKSARYEIRRSPSMCNKLTTIISEGFPVCWVKLDLCSLLCGATE